MTPAGLKLLLCDSQCSLADVSCPCLVTGCSRRSFSSYRTPATGATGEGPGASRFSVRRTAANNPTNDATGVPLLRRLRRLCLQSTTRSTSVLAGCVVPQSVLCPLGPVPCLRLFLCLCLALPSRCVSSYYFMCLCQVSMCSMLTATSTRRLS